MILLFGDCRPIHVVAHETAMRRGLEIGVFHDQHLPTLLKHARGVVVVNSTTGLQALEHQVPVKALGEAIYDMPGLCHQGPLDAFWHAAPHSAPDRVLLRRFVSFLIARSQLNGSFYKAWPKAATRSRNPWCATDWGDWLDRSAPGPAKGLATP